MTSSGAYVAVFVLNERNLIVRGPFDTYDEAKAVARTMSADPDEALVVKCEVDDA